MAGARLRLRVAGAGGPTIVLAPDPPNVIESMRGIIDSLAQTHRVVCVELPGFGFSTAPKGFDFSPQGLSDVLAALLEELGYGPYAVAFPCVAGLVSATIASSHPKLVSQVIGVQSPGLSGVKRWAKRVDPGGFLARPVIGQAVVLSSRRRLARAWFDVALADPSRKDRLVRATCESYDQGATYPLASALQAVRQARRPKPPSQPTLLVWGGRDRTHKATVHDELSPGSRVVVLRAAGHFPDIEDVPGFTAAVTSFLRGEVDSVS